jgi:hypothetical protein
MEELGDDPSLSGLQRSCADQLIIRCREYMSLPEICDSDHKPVCAVLEAEVPKVDFATRRGHAQRLLAKFHNTLKAKFVRSLLSQQIGYPVLESWVDEK